MKRTNAVAAAFEARTEQIARVGCALVDRLRAQPTPENLDELQDYVRLGLIIVEERLGSLRSCRFGLGELRPQARKIVFDQPLSRKIRTS